MDWHSSFVGRDDDLKILQDAWDEARTGTTRVVAIVAESGFGKTRLAQEFYNWLSTVHDGVGGAGYWPDRLLREADNLRVNPDPAYCGGDGGAADMPFLWWGLRLPDPGQRNAAATRSAFAASLDKLRPHLARLEREIERAALKRRQITGGGKTAGDVALSVAETAFDAFSGFATLGLGGIAKTVGKAGWDHHKASQDLRALDGLDIRPAAAEVRARDKLAESALGDLFRVCKSPPGGLDAIPLVILVDDIQWLDADAGTASFLDLLLARARTDGWPLLLVLTSWRQEWRSTVSAGRAPGTLADVEAGDVVHDLSGVQGLETIVRKAFPGLTTEQVDALAEKAEGTPRLLDEMLMYLARRRKAFDGRDVGAALTESGLADVLSRDFAAFVADRLQEAPEHVRRALAIASTQGVSFSPRLVRRIAEGLSVVDADAGLREGEDPHSFLAGAGSDTEAEFRLRAYRMAARDDLGNLLDEVDVEEQLRKALREVASDISAAGDRDLALVLDAATLLEDDVEKWRSAAIRAGGEMIERAQAASDGRTAWELAERLLPLFDNEASFEHRAVLISVIDAAALWTGQRPVFVEKIEAIVRQLRAPVPDMDNTRRTRQLAIALGRLGRVVWALNGSAAAWPLHEEAARLCRALAKERFTSSTRRELAIALDDLGGVIEEQEGPATARPVCEEAEQTFRALADEQPTPGARRELALALGRLGGVVEATDGPVAARPLREEAERLCRTLAEEEPTLGARHELTVALANLGGVVEALDGPAAARRLYEEAERHCRTLAEELSTPGTRRELALALARLGNVVEVLDGPKAARPLREEEKQLCSVLAEENPTLGARRDLALALGRLGDVVEAIDGPTAARPLREEDERLCRSLFAEHRTPATQMDLASTLSQLARLLRDQIGPAEAQPPAKEALELARTSHEAAPSLGSELWILNQRRDLARLTMLGSAPWEQAFSVERLPAQSAPVMGALERLAADFRTWGAKTDAASKAGWEEALQLDIAQCMLSNGDVGNALDLLVSSKNALDAAFALKPDALRALSADHALTTGICAIAAGDVERSLEAFVRAARINAPQEGRSPYALRRSAVIGWFHASLLQDIGRTDEAAKCFVCGHAVARAFARFEMMDGHAILRAYDAQLT